jgi:serine/threonine protein kinase
MSLRHPNIVTFIGTCLDNNNFFLVTEYLEKSETIEVSQESQDREARVKEIEIFFDELDKIDNLKNDFSSLQPELQEEFLSF